MRRLKIGLDCDDTINLWMDIYLARFGEPTHPSEITRNVMKVLRTDKKFWTSLPVKHRVDFEPTLYCTKRVNSKRYTKEWLRKNNFPIAPIYQVYNQSKNKADVIKGRIDVFVDDSVFNFKQLLSAGVPCLLMDSPWNRDFITPLRIYSLRYTEIEYVYNQAFSKPNIW